MNPSASNASKIGPLAELSCIDNAPIDLPSGVIGCLKPRSVEQENARSKRQTEFLEGRRCARIALERLNCLKSITTGNDRCPRWPNGFVGSISHSDRYVWAVAAKNTELLSIGIDTESIVDQGVIQSLKFEIGSAPEWTLVESSGLTPEAAFTTIFSAKESVYKCAYQLDPVFFGFDHARVVDIDSRTLTIALRPECPNSCLSRDELSVAYKISGDDVFTACWLVGERGGIR